MKVKKDLRFLPETYFAAYKQYIHVNQEKI